MGRARDAIMNGTFPDYVKQFFADYFGKQYPRWCVEALNSVGVDILEGREGVEVVTGNLTRWEYSERKK